ncbi:uncharacterized protein ASCRUDRAFT_115306 [Ascoidea rubescens DSM 1968]|uniref:Uncharacterized protein n=1 Tax=Ascoidea rubescens DSM 1968 TaxID=1344418 RepID=A0A1D2VBR1_9ASCO|nr:hypothetical protein ASCRUDRAFT_115306 [Ascoidea rubescens DSM 1968]ODV58992.1 hypothetical protein ASCRUDRAFT_115306 [Ascoidea rubescens DSM 1968]
MLNLYTLLIFPIFLFFDRPYKSLIRTIHSHFFALIQFSIAQKLATSVDQNRHHHFLLYFSLILYIYIYILQFIPELLL